MARAVSAASEVDSVTTANGDGPLVSVVLPVYNGERYLAAAIESVLGQTYRNFELLVVDDGSTDASASIATGFSDSRVRVVRFEKNEGLVSTLNKALGLVRGELVARLDADDVADGRRLELQVRRFLEDPQLVALGTGICFIDATGKSVRGSPPIVTGAALLRWRLIRGTCIYHPTLMLHTRRAGSPIRYSPEFIHAEDYELLLRLSRRHVLDNLSSILVAQRQHGQSVSVQYREQQRTSAARALRAHVREAYGLDLTEGRARSLIDPRGLLVGDAGQFESPVPALLGLEQRFLATEAGLSHGDRLAIRRDVALFAWKLLAFGLVEWGGGGRLQSRLPIVAGSTAILCGRPIQAIEALLRRWRRSEPT